MKNETIILKVRLRLNKLASNDYDNIETYQIVEAFNKGMVSWCRRNLHGLNLSKEGDEQSKRRIDDLQVLLTTDEPIIVKKDGYIECNLSSDYLEYKRITASFTTECCKNKIPLVVYLVEEGNVDLLLRDANTKPSAEWGETFATLSNNKVKIYTNNEFDIHDVKIIYYRQPRRIQLANIEDPYTGNISTSDIECEFKDDLIELFIDEAVKILAGDIESWNVYTKSDTSVESNN